MPDNQQGATALLGQIPFPAVIGAPLKAAVEAQAAAAIACADFILSVGFDKEDQANARKVKVVTFTFERAGAGGGQAQTVSLTVPLLAIMPVPFIRIESLTVNFKASIQAIDERSQEEKKSTEFAGQGEAALGFALWKASVKASVSSKKDSTATSSSKYSVEHTMDVSLHAVQDDMPSGLAKVLTIMTDAIAVRP